MEHSNDHNLEIIPSNEIKFKGPFTHIVTSPLKLKNIGNKTLYYKVKTTVPKMYCVRPNSGSIDSGKEVDISIMLQPFEYCATEKVRHKFLIQSIIADEGNLENSENLWKTVDKEMIREIKLKCSFEQQQSAGDVIAEDDIVPSRNVSNNSQPGLGMTVEELKKQLADLKHENDKLKSTESRLRKLALQDTLENQVLPTTSLDDSKQKFTNNYMLLIILCFIAFMIGIVAAKFTF